MSPLWSRCRDHSPPADRMQTTQLPGGATRDISTMWADQTQGAAGAVQPARATPPSSPSGAADHADGGARACPLPRPGDRCFGSSTRASASPRAPGARVREGCPGRCLGDLAGVAAPAWGWRSTHPRLQADGRRCRGRRTSPSRARASPHSPAARDQHAGDRGRAARYGQIGRARCAVMKCWCLRGSSRYDRNERARRTGEPAFGVRLAHPGPQSTPTARLRPSRGPPTAIVGASEGAGRPSIRRCERVA